jgi:hypothetical protein
MIRESAAEGSASADRGKTVAIVGQQRAAWRWSTAATAAAVGMAALLEPLPALAADTSTGPTFLKSCTISAPDIGPIWPSPAAADDTPAKGKTAKAKPAAGKAAATATAKTSKVAADSDDDDDDSSDDDSDSDDDDDDDDDDSDDTTGILIPQSSLCLALSGTLTFGLQQTGVTADRLLKIAGVAPKSNFAPQFSGSLTFSAKSTLDNGVEVIAVVSGTGSNAQPASAPSLSEVSLTVGPVAAGLMSSRFDFWTGDEFIYSAQVPNRTVGLLGFDLPVTDTTSLSLSLERPQLDQSQSSVATRATGSKTPDPVLRLLYDGDSLTVQGSFALHGLGSTSGNTGKAVLIGATWTTQLAGRTASLTGQWAGAINAPTYLGSQLDQRTTRAVIFAEDPTRGWSGVVSGQYQWTDTITSNAFASVYRLSLPVARTVSGEIAVDRIAVNTTWEPNPGVKVGLEGMVSWQQIDITGRQRSGLAVGGRVGSLQLFVQGTF